MKNPEKKNPQHSQSGSRQSDESENRDSSQSSRSEIDATHGDDAIEIEINEAERLAAMTTFAPLDGDLSEESEDSEDLPVEERKNRNVYDPSLSAGGSSAATDREKPEGIHVSRAFQAGVSFKDKDSYVDEEGVESDKKPKANRADNWAAADNSEEVDES